MDLCPVYGWWQIAKGEPFDRCTWDEAKRLISLDLARGARKGKAIQLLNPPPDFRYDLRGISCSPGPSSIIAALLGSQLATITAASYQTCRIT